MVNSEMMVSVNMPAIVSPTFVAGASPIGLIPGDNSPFTYVSWNAMQSMVVTTGATFAVQAVEIGANQVAVPIGDATLVTCGPFECMMGMDAPDITIANSPKCTNWDPTVELHMGLVDNDVMDTDADGDDTANDGIDLGWVTSSSLAMTVKHVFSGVARGTNGSASSKAAKGDDKSLPGANFSTAITADVADDEDDVDDVPVIACVPDAGETAGDSTQGGRNYPGRTRTGIFKPGNCIRLTGLGAAGKATATTKGPDWLSGYTLEMSATGAEVDWGSSVEWDTDPFEDLTCDSVTVAAADYLDVCSLFEEEVDEATGGDWTFTAMWGGTAADGNDSTSRATMWTLAPDDAAAKRFSTLWFDDDLDGKIKNKNPDRPSGAGDLHDLYDNNATGGEDTDDARANLEVVWQLMTNTDGSPNRGDFGKVDLVSDEDDEDTDDNETEVAGNPDGNADNYDSSTRGFRNIRKCSDDDNGDGCDAKWSETFDIAFADGTFGCEAMASVTVKCEWDAQGGLGQGRGGAQNQFTPGTNNANFYKCTAE